MYDRPIVLFGEFPPPYGGVAVKDQLIFQNIFQGMNTQLIDLVGCKRMPYKTPVIFCQMVAGMVASSAVIIGVGTTWRRKVLLLLQRLLTGSRGMKKQCCWLWGPVS